jgi:hypothetical protein
VLPIAEGGRRILSITAEYFNKKEHAAQARVHIEYGPTPFTQHTVNVEIKWRAMKELGQVVKRGLYDEKIGVPQRLTVATSIDPPNQELLDSLLGKINEHVSSERIKVVGPPRVSRRSCLAEVVAESPFGDDPDACIDFLRQLLLWIAVDVHDPEFRRTLDSFHPTKVRRGGMLKNYVPSSAILPEIAWRTGPFSEKRITPPIDANIFKEVTRTPNEAYASEYWSTLQFKLRREQLAQAAEWNPAPMTEVLDVFENEGLTEDQVNRFLNFVKFRIPKLSEQLLTTIKKEYALRMSQRADAED